MLVIIWRRQWLWPARLAAGPFVYLAVLPPPLVYIIVGLRVRLGARVRVYMYSMELSGRSRSPTGVKKLVCARAAALERSAMRQPTLLAAALLQPLARSRETQALPSRLAKAALLLHMLA